MDTTQRSQTCGHESREVNVGDVERALSLIAGGALAVRALRKIDLANLALAALGVGLIFRGLTGHCGLYQALGSHGAQPDAERQSSTRQTTGGAPGMADDLVGEASLESFPASDPPAWTSAASMPMPARTPHVTS